jgi:hypothetical protein
MSLTLKKRKSANSILLRTKKPRFSRSSNSPSNSPSSIESISKNKYIMNILKKCGIKNPVIEQTYDSDNHGFLFKPFKCIDGDNTYVMKPKPAILDRQIMELFNDINKVNDKSESLELPYYEIESCGSISIWKFIEGKLVIDYGHLDAFSTAEETDWKKLKKVVIIHKNRVKNLEYLNTVCSLIGVTDLHGENVILQGDMYYPIDLEVVDKSNITGLYGFQKEGPINKSLLNRESLELIKKFNRKVTNLPNRFLPINTKDFLAFLGDDDDVTADILADIFLSNKKATNVNRSDLLFYFKKCYRKRIIPYFLIDKGKVQFYDFKKHKFESFLSK